MAWPRSKLNTFSIRTIISPETGGGINVKMMPPPDAVS
jgi:hypothetical protein